MSELTPEVVMTELLPLLWNRDEEGIGVFLNEYVESTVDAGRLLMSLATIAATIALEMHEIGEAGRVPVGLFIAGDEPKPHEALPFQMLTVAMNGDDEELIALAHAAVSYPFPEMQEIMNTSLQVLIMVDQAHDEIEHDCKFGADED